MPVLRILLLLVVLGGLALFAVQNLSPVLPIVFLGMKTQALPLAVWFVLALASGFFTSACLQFLSYLLWRPEQAQPESPRESSQTASQQKTSYAPPQQKNPTTDDDSDWQVEESVDSEEWDFDKEPEPTSSKQVVDRDPTTYEVKQEPKSSNSSGTVYSYSYREPKNSGVGRTEAVYDANYRVITPPYSGSSKKKEEDDWGILDDELEDEGNEGARSPRRK